MGGQRNKEYVRMFYFSAKDGRLQSPDKHSKLGHRQSRIKGEYIVVSNWMKRLNIVN